MMNREQLIQKLTKKVPTGSRNDIMSQVTNGIFAAPGQIAPLPTIRANRATSSSTKLVVTDAEGRVLQSWLLKQPKCTLGSAETCSIVCSLAGIAPLHALIVTGARQIFVRSLAGKLSQDGIPATELLLGENNSYFDLAGYRFTLIRQAAEDHQAEQVQAKRMRFALARPLSIHSSTDVAKDYQPEEKSLSAPWVANVIREAIEPLEAQIDSLLLPLAEFQAKSLQAQLSAAHEAEEEKRLAAEKARETKEVEIMNMVAQQSANMETLAERISDVNSQLSSIERIIAQDAQLNASAKVETDRVVSVQQTAIEQLQVGMVSVSESIRLLQEQQRAAQSDNLTWKNEVQLQLQQLTSAVSEFSDIAKNNQQPELLEAIESLRQTHEFAQSEIHRWQQGVQKQLDVLQEKLRENDDTAQQHVPTQLAEAISEIQAKHEQTLVELQSWKSELRQEMHDLLQSASESRISQSIPKQDQYYQSEQNGFQSSDDEVASIPESIHGESDRSIDAYAVDSALNYGHFENSPVVDSYLTQGTSGVDEQFIPELVSDDMVKTANDQLAAPIVSDSLPVQESEAWSTQQFDSDRAIPTGSEAIFGDQWGTAATGEVLENQSTASAEMLWDFSVDSTQNNLQQAYVEQHDFVAPPTDPAEHYSSDDAASEWASDFRPPMDESQGFYMPDSQSLIGFDGDNQSSQDPGSNVQFQNANLGTGVEAEVSQSGQLPWLSSQPVEQAVSDHSTLDQSPGNNQTVSDSEQLSSMVSGRAEEPQAQNTNWSERDSATYHSRENETQRRQSALPSWWTETDEQAVEDSSHQHSVAPVLTEAGEDPQFDLSHLYTGGSGDQDYTATKHPASTNQGVQASDDETLFGLGVKSSEFFGENGVDSPSPTASALDRFMQREHELADDQKDQKLAGFEKFSTGEQPDYQLPSSRPVESYEKPQAPEPVPQSPYSPASAASSDDEGEESVEAYMRNLLARMRGDSPEPVANSTTSVASPTPAASSQQSPYELRRAMRIQPDEGEQVEPIDLDNYVPLSNAPEKGKNISALRDLANVNARTAIHKSTRRRTLSGSLMKFAISAIALTVAAALFAINGLSVNIAFVATMAALFVAVIWGYDGIKCLKPLLQNALVLQPTNDETEESTGE